MIFLKINIPAGIMMSLSTTIIHSSTWKHIIRFTPWVISTSRNSPSFLNSNYYICFLSLPHYLIQRWPTAARPVISSSYASRRRVSLSFIYTGQVGIYTGRRKKSTPTNRDASIQLWYILLYPRRRKKNRCTLFHHAPTGRGNTIKEKKKLLHTTQERKKITGRSTCARLIPECIYTCQYNIRIFSLSCPLYAPESLLLFKKREREAMRCVCSSGFSFMCRSM